MVIARKDLEVRNANESAERAAKEASLAQQRTIFSYGAPPSPLTYSAEIQRLEQQLREAQESAELAPHSPIGNILPRNPNDSFLIADASTSTSELYAYKL